MFKIKVNKIKITLGFHVDDGIILSRSKEAILWFKNEMKQEFRDITAHNEDDLKIIGMRMQRLTDGSLELYMDDKIEGVTETVGNTC